MNFIKCLKTARGVILLIYYRYLNQIQLKSRITQTIELFEKEISKMNKIIIRHNRNNTQNSYSFQTAINK